jgi:hypothetical protein
LTAAILPVKTPTITNILSFFVICVEITLV